jgi:hypothetical protein
MPPVSIRIPFTFEAEVLFNRKRKPIRDLFVAEADFEIRDVCKDLTKEVVTWKRFFTSFFASEEAEFEGTITDNNAIRLFAGKFYRPAIKNRQIGSETLPAVALAHWTRAPLSLSESVRISNQFAYLAGPKSDVIALTKFLSGKSVGIDEADITTVLSSQEAERREDLSRRVGNLISIDGFLYERVYEPAIALSTTMPYLDLHVGPTHYGSIVNSQSGLIAASPAKMLFFPVDHLDRARSIADEMGMRQGWETPDYRLTAPEVMSFDLPRDIASRTMDFILDAHSPMIGHLDATAVSAFLELRGRSEQLRDTSEVEVDPTEEFAAIDRFLDQTGDATPTDVLSEYEDCRRIYEELTSSRPSPLSLGGPNAGR